MKIIPKKVIFQKNDFAIITDKNEEKFQFKKLSHKIEDLISTPLEIETEEIIHPKYGKQYVVTNYKILETPLSFFLKKIAKTGLPKEAIYSLDNKYTLEEFFNLLNSNPTLLLKEKHIGKKRLEEIIKKFNENKDLIELTNLLAEANVSSNLFNDIYKYLKKKKLKTDDLKKNPYLLTAIDGIGFKKADSIALSLGIKKDSLLRIKAFILYYIDQEVYQSGNTLIEENKIFNACLENLELEEVILRASFYTAILELIEFQQIDKIEIDNNNYYIKNNYKHMEEYIIEIIKKYNDMRFWQNNLTKAELFNYTNPRDIKLSSKQKRAIEDFATTTAPFFILGGYAGSGKTTTSKKIMDIYAEIWGKENIVACALSGNASNRIKNVTGYKAYTIHSLLGYKGNEFEFNEDNPLPYKLVVLDEASMVDIFLFYSLLKAIDFTQTKLFIIGDNAQLPPVGAGEIFNDMLNIEHIEKVILDKVFRQSEDQVINVFAQDIRKGKIPYRYKDKYEDFEFVAIEIEDYFKKAKTLKEKEKKELRNEINSNIKSYIINYSKQINDEILYLLKNTAFEYLKINNLEKFKTLISKYIYYYQVIAPQKNGILGTYNLNLELKNIFNPNQPHQILNIAKQDKVIHLKNKNKSILSLEEYINFEKMFYEETPENQILMFNAILNKELDWIKEKRVFNGQVGIVLNTYMIKTSEENEMFEYIAVYFPDDDYVTFYNSFEIRNKIIDLEYSFTIHKSQGSEYSFVTIPISLSNAFMLNNKLLYTAVTRAKKKLTLVGESYAFNLGIKKIDETKRNTLLKLLKEK